MRVLVPTAEDLAVTGANVMDARRRRAVFETAVRTTAARLARVPRSEEPAGEPEAGEAS